MMRFGRIRLNNARLPASAWWMKSLTVMSLLVVIPGCGARTGSALSTDDSFSSSASADGVRTVVDLTAGAGLTAVATSADSPEEGWGTIEGQFILKGEDLPELPPLVTQGDASVRDPDVCAANGVPDETLVINEENRGIANICLYMRRAPDDIHPDLAESEDSEVVFDQKGCRFLPHVLIVRTDQTVLVKSDDPVPHNTRTGPFKNAPVNLTISANDRDGVEVPMPQSELQFPPVNVKCDIHPWMSAWWMVADHPYVAVTDADGKFRIENLPEGTHVFRVWHERPGYLETEVFSRDLEITVESGEVTELEPIEVSADIFFKD